MSVNIAKGNKKRVVIVGGGFGGLKIAESLRHSGFQVILVDKNNYHQFSPLIYQVASSGLEPSSIAFPFRKLLNRYHDIHFRMAEARLVFPEKNILQTSIGKIEYDYLVFAAGATSNFFGNRNIEEEAIPMKTLSEAMGLRNALLSNFERSVTCATEKERNELLNIVVVGGGATGVEISGAIAEMKRNVLPKDYPDMDIRNVNIYLIEAADRLLSGMSKESSLKAHKFLEEIGVKVMLNKKVIDYKDNRVILEGGLEIPSRTFIWVSGICANKIENLSPEVIGRGRRIKVDKYNRVIGYQNIFCIGDQCLMDGDPNYPNGHPQLAQVAIQQGKLLAKNLKAEVNNKELKPFKYKNLGSMATVGRNKAVAEFNVIKTQGWIAWILWLVVHLRSILGVHNKINVFLNWVWNYFTYDLSFRLIFEVYKAKEVIKREERESKVHWGKELLNEETSKAIAK